MGTHSETSSTPTGSEDRTKVVCSTPIGTVELQLGSEVNQETDEVSVGFNLSEATSLRMAQDDTSLLRGLPLTQASTNTPK